MPRISVRLCCLSASVVALIILAGQSFVKKSRYSSASKIVKYEEKRLKFDSEVMRRLDAISPKYDMGSVDCMGVLENRSESMSHALSQVPKYKGWTKTDQDYQKATQDCQAFRKEFGYITDVLSQEEIDFPLAYSLVVFKDIEAVERLLRAVYRPNNVYCLHVDIKAKEDFTAALRGVSGCLENVFIAERRIDVQWANFTVLEAELVCMEELWKRAVKWKYFINLTGQEFPLKSNRELVEILTAYKGANDVEGVRRGANKNRWEASGPTPENIIPTKGSVHVVLNRDFVDFILHTPVAKRFIEWVKPQEIADETFFATLGHNPQLGIRGTFVGLDDVERIMARKPWFGRYKSWLDWPCAGIRGRDICILSTGDLPRMHKSPFFFANKFYLNYDRLAYGCLEQRLFNRSRDLYLGKWTVNTTIYEESILVRNRLEL